eukprot:3627570-Rhodomonas_salina.2
MPPVEVDYWKVTSHLGGACRLPLVQITPTHASDSPFSHISPTLSQFPDSIPQFVYRPCFLVSAFPCVRAALLSDDTGLPLCARLCLASVLSVMRGVACMTNSP